MQSFVPLVYDISTICVFVYMIGVCARRGFARTIVSFLGYAGAIVFSSALSKPLASAAYNALIKPAVIEALSAKIGEVQGEILPENLLDVVQSLPGYPLEAVGLDKDQMLLTLQDIITNGGRDAASSIADAVVAPIAVMLLKMIFFLISFTVLMFFVRKLVGVFRGVNRLPLIGPANRILGGAVGAAQAALTMYVIAVLLSLVVSFSGRGIAIQVRGEDLVLASREVFNRTILFKAFVNTNPLDLMMLRQSIPNSLDSLEKWVESAV